MKITNRNMWVCMHSHNMPRNAHLFLVSILYGLKNILQNKCTRKEKLEKERNTLKTKLKHKSTNNRYEL